MSLRNRLQDIIQQETPTNAYSNQLKKDISRVEQFTRDCDRVLPTLHDSDSIDKQIIALYDTYGRIPYNHDKNDTINTAATSVILQELIKKYASPKPPTTIDLSFLIAQLEANNKEKQKMLQTLHGSLSPAFESPLESKVEEASQLQTELDEFIKVITSRI